MSEATTAQAPFEPSLRDALPLVVDWISRVWMEAQRGRMHDDPVVFAVRDPVSLACGALFAPTLLSAR